MKGCGVVSSKTGSGAARRDGIPSASNQCIQLSMSPKPEIGSEESTAADYILKSGRLKG